MLTETLKTLFSRDLDRLKAEIQLYQNEKKIWYIEKGIANSAGNLCIHLIGNLNTYIGAQLGQTNYIRHRELEFSQKDIPKAELLSKIEETARIVDRTISNLTDEELKKEHPALVFDKKTSIEYLLVHLTTHLTYHLGQINYHRRLLDN